MVSGLFHRLSTFLVNIDSKDDQKGNQANPEEQHGASITIDWLDHLIDPGSHSFTDLIPYLPELGQLFLICTSKSGRIFE